MKAKSRRLSRREKSPIACSVSESREGWTGSSIKQKVHKGILLATQSGRLHSKTAANHFYSHSSFWRRNQRKARMHFRRSISRLASPFVRCSSSNAILYRPRLIIANRG